MYVLHNGYSTGVPVKVNVKDISLKEIDAPNPLREFQIMALFRGQLLPIGYIIVYGSKYSILFDPRPFIWNGSDIWIGRKLVRLIKFQGGSVKERISELLNDHLSPEQLAS